MTSYHVIRVGSFTQYKYAWYEPPENARYADDWPKCPVCKRPVGGRYWLPPRRVTLKQPRRVGDFVYGPGGADLIVSGRFRSAYEQEGLTGITTFYPVEVSRMGTTKKAKEYPVPVLAGIQVQHGPARVLYDQMGVVWSKKPDPDYCRTCGPGGGGGGGILHSFERVAVDESTWRGEDFFFPINFSGQILVSQRAREFVERHRFTNVVMTPCEQYGYSF